MTLLLIYQDKATLPCGLARLGPNHIAEWHLVLVSATYVGEFEYLGSNRRAATGGWSGVGDRAARKARP